MGDHQQNTLRKEQILNWIPPQPKKDNKDHDNTSTSVTVFLTVVRDLFTHQQLQYN